MDTWLFGLHVVVFSCFVVLSFWQVLPKEIVPSGAHTVCIHEYSARISLISSVLVVLSF